MTTLSPEYAASLHPCIPPWLRRLYSTGHAHGSDLAEALGRPYGGKPGLSDNCRWSDRILEILTTAGWIVRAKDPTPSKAQLFFGWGGRAPGRRPNASTAGASEFAYTVGESEGLRAFLGG